MRKAIDNFFIFVIKLYQAMLSPYFGGHCRFYPTCSDYAIEAIKTFGAAKGAVKAVGRVLRCNPFSKGGVDFPVKHTD